MTSISKKSTPAKKDGNGTSKARQAKTRMIKRAEKSGQFTGAGKRRVRRDDKTGDMSTKEVTLRAFRRTYDRLHPRKDK